MKRNIVPVLLGLLALVVTGVGVLIAQEKTFNVAVPPPPDGSDNVMFYANGGDEPDEDVLIQAPHAGAAVAHAGGPQERKFFFRTEGEGGGWLGVSIDDVNAEKAKALKLASEAGAVIVKVHEDSPAAKAGLQKDDVIVEFAGEKVRSAAQLRRLVRETPADRTVTITVNRAGQTRTLSAQLEKPKDFFFQMPAPAVAAAPLPHIKMPDFNFAWMDRGARLGISADELTPQLAEFFGVKQGKGILVREVVVGSAAEKAGLKAGDVIVAVDGQEVASVGKLRRALAGEKEQTEKRKVALTIVRDKREQTLSVELEAPQKIGPRQLALTVPHPDPEEMQELAADAAAQAREYAEHAREMEDQALELHDQKEELQQEMQRLKEELPGEINKEINREMQNLKVNTGVV
ncbi:MAG: PDZ domain-containing protein [Terriglobia bacterium]